MAYVPGKLFIIAAPSGAGKTTLINNVIATAGNLYNLHKVITYTSRPPRPLELSGKDYFFVSAEDFKAKEKENFFLETTTYDNHSYGSPASLLKDLLTGMSFIMVLDRAGAQHIKKLIPTTVLIWLTVPSIEVLAHRLSQRTLSEKLTIHSRLALAQKEIEIEEKEQIFDYHILNDDLATAVQKLIALIKKELSSDHASFL